jgi:hypothetical protein
MVATTSHGSSAAADWQSYGRLQRTIEGPLPVFACQDIATAAAPRLQGGSIVAISIQRGRRAKLKLLVSSFPLMIQRTTSTWIFRLLHGTGYIHAQRNALVAFYCFAQSVAAAIILTWLSNYHTARTHFKDLILELMALSV